MTSLEGGSIDLCVPERSLIDFVSLIAPCNFARARVADLVPLHDRWRQSLIMLVQGIPVGMQFQVVFGSRLGLIANSEGCTRIGLSLRHSRCWA